MEVGQGQNWGCSAKVRQMNISDLHEYHMVLAVVMELDVCR
jgi:hypothetical protein